MTAKQRISIARNTGYETRNTPSQNGSTLVRRNLEHKQPTITTLQAESNPVAAIGSDGSEKTEEKTMETPNPSHPALRAFHRTACARETASLAHSPTSS